MSPRVKICGVTRPDDARAAAQAGAHSIGLNFFDESLRFVGGLSAARKLLADCTDLTDVAWAGVFVNHSTESVLKHVSTLNLRIIQLHGEEPPEQLAELRAVLDRSVQIWKAFRVADANDLKATEAWPCDGWVIDAKVPGVRGGTGKTFDWALLKALSRSVPLVLSGGLNPRNVAEAVRVVAPDWVDVASGVEMAPGVKDPALMRAFVSGAVRS